MTCRDLIAFLDRYLAGEVPPEERARFDAHLARCERCVVYLRTYEETARLGRRAYADGDLLAPDVPDELVAAILAARRG